MKNILYYVPSLLTVLVIILLEESLLKWVLLSVLALSVVISKFKRSKQPSDEVEYDERVNTNIRFWSFGFLAITNVLLIVYLLLVSQSFISEWMTIENMMIYLSMSLLVSFYIIPSVVKKF